MFQWLLSLLGICFGLGFGTLLGLSVGPYIFPAMLKPRDLSYLDEAADKDDEQAAPEAGTAVSSSMRPLLEFAEPWTTSPDYQRVRCPHPCIAWACRQPCMLVCMH